MTRSAITHMRQTGPRDTAARMGVVCPAAWGIGDVGYVGRFVGRFADRAVITAYDAPRPAMRRRREH